MNHNQKIGKFGENLAKDYLIRRGYKIISSNLKISYQELDIIARRHGLIIFVEVKTRISQIYGPAENAFVFSKSERIKRGVEMFIRNNKIAVENIRIDLITVDINRAKKTAKIKHFQDVI